MFLRAQGKGVNVDASVGSTGVVLEGLDNVEVRTLSLRDSVLAVKLELGSDDGVLAPAVHVEGSLSKHIGAGIGNIGTIVGGAGNSIENIGTAGSSVGVTSRETKGRTRGYETIKGTGHLEDTSRNEGAGTRKGSITTKDVDSRGQGINGVSVVKRLGSKDLVEGIAADQRTAIIDVGIRLNNPDELLARVVEVDLDLVGRRSDRLITSVLELLNEVLMGVGRHLSALIGIQEDEINVDGGSNEGLLVSLGDRDRTRGGSNVTDGPQALTNGSEVDVDLDLVVLESNEGKSKTGVSAEPEEEGNVEGGLRERLARSANLTGTAGSRAGSVDIGKVLINEVGKLSGVTNHLVVSSLLLGRQGELIPDVHPVTILSVNSLTTNLDLDLGDELLTGEI